MYLKSWIYKVFSIVSFALSVLGILAALIISFSAASAIISFFPWLSNYLIGFQIILTLLLLLNFFFGYVEFSSMFAFANMIDYIQGDSPYPMKRSSFVAKPSFYRGFGSAIFIITLIAEMLYIIILTVFASIQKQYFLAVPVLPMIGSAITTILAYILYYVKFKSIGDLLEITATQNPSQALLESFAENKPRVLRKFCIFLFVIAIIQLILVAIGIFLIIINLSPIIGTGFTIFYTVSLIIAEVLSFIYFAVIGCYLDNIAKMVEHYMIKYKLL